MLNKRNKGKRGELELINILKKEGLFFTRNLDQTRDGGADLICDQLPQLCIEVKRCETLQIEKWWRQTCRECSEKQIPCLIYRQSKKSWTVVTLGSIIYSDEYVRITVTLTTWIKWVKTTCLK